jgi:hypothetical protein
MKSILLFIGALTLLTTSGCVIRERRGGGEFHERGEYRGHEYREHSGYIAPDAGVNVRIHAD